MAATQPPGSRLASPPSSAAIETIVYQVTPKAPRAVSARGALLRAGISPRRPGMSYAASANTVTRMPAMRVSHWRPPG